MSGLWQDKPVAGWMLATAWGVGVALACQSGAAQAADPAKSWQDLAPAGTTQSVDRTHRQRIVGTSPVTRYPTLAEFQTAAAHMTLAFEDFSSNQVNGASPCYEPVNHAGGQPATDLLAPTCFVSGDLIEGFGIRSDFGSPGNAWGTMLFEPPIGGLTVNVVGATSPGARTYVDFHGGPIAVAMDAFDWQAGSPLEITVLGDDDTVIDEFTLAGNVPSQGVFVGLVSTVPIRRVEVASLSTASQMIGNLRFGGVPGGIAAEPSTIHFGAMGVGDGRTLVMQLRQQGDLPVLVPSLPDVQAPFSVVNDGCSGNQLPVAGTCQVVYAFDPDLAGAYRQELALPDIPGLDRASSTVVFTGRAVVRELRVDRSEIVFDAVGVGETAQAAVRLENLSAVPLSITDIGEPTPPFQHWAVAEECAQAPFILAPGEHCQLGFEVVPDGPGQFVDRVLIASTDPSTPLRLLLRTTAGDVIFADGFE